MSEFTPRPIAPTDRVLKTNDDAGAAIDARQPFRNANGTFYALEWTPERPGTIGQLPAQWAARLGAVLAACGRVYVVYSYATPIAWTVAPAVGTGPRGPVTLPNVRYSPTTDRHQWAAARADYARWETIDGADIPPVTHRPAH